MLEIMPRFCWFVVLVEVTQIYGFVLHDSKTEQFGNSSLCYYDAIIDTQHTSYQVLFDGPFDDPVAEVFMLPNSL